jgi:hypothetical protein
VAAFLFFQELFKVADLTNLKEELRAGFPGSEYPTNKLGAA